MTLPRRQDRQPGRDAPGEANRDVDDGPDDERVGAVFGEDAGFHGRMVERFAGKINRRLK